MTRGVAGSGLILAGLFLAFLAALAPAEGAGAATAPVTRSSASAGGELLFRTKGCAACHSVAAKGIRTYIPAGPDLSVATADFGSRRPGMSAAEYLAQSMRAPQAFLAPAATGAIDMPDLGLSDAEIDALVRFLLRS